MPGSTYKRVDRPDMGVELRCFHPNLGMVQNHLHLVFAVDTVFERIKDGVWCRRDAEGRLYPGNRYGERCARPKQFQSSMSC